jgi:AcrR family transcriptional regulator
LSVVTAGADVVYLRSYDDRARVDDAEARKALDAAVELLREVPYDRVTMRMIGRRAGMAYRSLCAHFRSTDAIVAEIYLQRLRAAPLTVDVDQDARSRIADQFHELVMLLADEPGLAAACSAALIGDEPGVRSIRQRINAEYHRRVCTALRSGAWPEVTETLHFGLIGALVQASCGAGGFRETADELAGVVAAVLPATQTPAQPGSTQTP